MRPVRVFRRDQVTGGVRVRLRAGPASPPAAQVGSVQGVLCDEFGRAAPAEPMPPVAVADVFEAYYACRRRKRRTHSAMAFEVDFEDALVGLWRDINDGSYRPAPAHAFIVRRPVQREIFAAEFRDRIVHHLLIGRLGPVLDRDLIHDAYACRVGRGTSMGISRAQRFLRAASLGDTRECWVLRLDIRGFFMHINTTVLLDRVEVIIMRDYHGADRDRLLWLLRMVVLSRPADTCRVRGSRRDWRGLPREKSLFHSPRGCGLPIGNLTSQVLANSYLSGLDHLIKSGLGVRWYGRYVDDLILVDPDRRRLRAAVPAIRAYLVEELGCQLHDRKVRLSRYSQGVQFLGVVIKPGRTYCGQRAKGRFHQLLRERGCGGGVVPADASQADALVASVNSYLGLLRPFASYRLRRSALRRHLGGWWSLVYVTGGYRVLRKSV